VTRIDPELGTEKLCARCGEWWPLDAEFYYLSQPARCKACWAEDNRIRRANPRFHLVGTRAYR
jgi:hypothetical protein